MIDSNIAIINDDKSISFSELSKTVNRTAQYYFDNGVRSKSLIAILANNSLEYVITVFSLWKVGASPVPINTRLNEVEINHIVKSSGCSILIVDNNYSEAISGFKTIEMQIKYEGTEYTDKHEISGDDNAVIIHTSGSSGFPKGVMITNNNLYQSYLSTTDAFNFSNKDVFLASLPFYHIGGFAIISRALLSGGVLVTPKSLKQNDIVAAMAKFNPSVISLVPTMLQRIIGDGVNPNTNLRLLFLGGGPSSDDLIHSSLDKGWPIVKVYGSSETTAMVTGSWGENLKLHPASGGKPFSNVEIRILDEFKNIVIANVVGEIAIKGESVASGYINNSKLWKEKIHNGFYLTGDYGYLDESNNLFVLSRRTDLIVSGGENIDPREVENILCENREISDSFVFPIPNPEWGQVPVALVVLKKNSNLTVMNIKTYLRSVLASYKIPKTILIVNEIPKTELGKVNLEKAKELIKRKF